MEIVTFKKSDGKRIEARLISENVKTALVKPYRWLKSKVVKIHKKKQSMKFTGITI